ncbi:hypothetical protein CUMW_094070 [Citrus unshiu]|uniref:Expansin-like EG45 domain-containing protein n=1 Tax=Citrus unshiu TaxID=55188 RepID=A0A2H5P1T4_CITUN|nr:hypothetical protein CUMW_094070 [Citrus unshiu]
MAILLCFLFFLLSSATACDHCVHQSKVSYFSKTSALSKGACGYGSLALGLGSGHIAAAVPSIYKNGAACGGTCFQVRCKNRALCSRKGTRVIVTDLNHNNKTDMVLSRRAFRALANKGMDKEIFKQRAVDVEYIRVPCEYKHHNLAVRVEESSKNPNYLAIKVLYQGGKTEILGVVLSEYGSPVRVDMRRKFGAVWETDRAPKGPLQFGFPIVQGFDVKWIWAKNPVPADWKIGVTYDTGVQITDVDFTDGCAECGPWN